MTNSTTFSQQLPSIQTLTAWAEKKPPGIKIHPENVAKPIILTSPFSDPLFLEMQLILLVYILVLWILTHKKHWIYWFFFKIYSFSVWLHLNSFEITTLSNVLSKHIVNLSQITRFFKQNNNPTEKRRGLTSTVS